MRTSRLWTGSSQLFLAVAIAAAVAIVAEAALQMLLGTALVGAVGPTLVLAAIVLPLAWVAVWRLSPEPPPTESGGPRNRPMIEDMRQRQLVRRQSVLLTSRVDMLRQLADLKESGILSAEEFEAQKAKILAQL